MIGGLYRPLVLGPIRLDGNILGAPMAGYSDHISRSLALRHGAASACTEMISADALVRGSRRSVRMLRRCVGERILAVQLFGSSPETLGTASRIAADAGADILDLNAGCPVRKVVNRGAGAALAGDPARLALAVRAMTEAGLPVTVKFRSGWDSQNQNWREVFRACVDSGACALGFHPRTRAQGYGGKSDWNLLTVLAAESEVPVIGSGDLFSPDACESMLRTTGCAGVMIARGAVGNPRIYGRTISLLTTGEPGPDWTMSERLDAALEHLEMAVSEYGPETAVSVMKKHMAGYIQGWNSAAELRHSLMMARDVREFADLLTGTHRNPSR